jgi:DNA modification methylase
MIHNETDDVYETDEAEGKGWKLLLGDSCERMAEIETDSVDLGIYSPPFSSLYVYSPSVRDMGNSVTREEFFQHFGFVISEMLRVTKPGRMNAVHVMDLPTTKAAHGQVGLTDFSGQVIAAYHAAGWIYVNRITIRKNPQAAATRTKSHGLQFAQLRRDRSQTRPVYPDYLLLFRKPGQNAVPITSHLGPSGTDAGDNELWIKWAEAIWDDICETNTLNVEGARDDRDERHLCPLQKDLIERAIRLWSNPGETVFSPFAGVGSELYMAVKNGRRGVGIELKPSYYRTAIKNIQQAESDANAVTLFD